MMPIKFGQVEFYDVSYQNQQFEMLIGKWQDCNIDQNSNFKTQICYNITWYIARYYIPERNLKLQERINCGIKYENWPWRVVFSQRNSAFYLTWDKVISMPLEEMIYDSHDSYNRIWYSHNIWKTPKDEWYDDVGIQESNYIQYVPLEEWETILSVIQQLKTTGQLVEHSSCSDKIIIP